MTSRPAAVVTGLALCSLLSASMHAQHMGPREVVSPHLRAAPPGVVPDVTRQHLARVAHEPLQEAVLGV